jgi:hypothetical protein
MRLSKYLTSMYGSDPQVTHLLDTTEVWVVPVANPDGYQYTFTTERLWRKNLRDNNGDGQIQIGDGVDLNRNFDSHWGYENEGSAPSRLMRPTGARRPTPSRKRRPSSTWSKARTSSSSFPTIRTAT